MENVREAYLARFEAMVADFRGDFGDALYTEASQHAEDGSIIFHPDDELPRRIDVVSPEGDEFNLELGEPLPPSPVEEFEELPFQVKLHPCCWEGLSLSVKFQEPLSEGQWDTFANLLHSWFMTGFWGGYGGYLHSLQELNYGGRMARCIVDMGSADVVALISLLEALSGFGSESVELEKVSFGEAPTLVS